VNILNRFSSGKKPPEDEKKKENDFEILQQKHIDQLPISIFQFNGFK